MSTFQMQEQEADQWCWAAVAVSVANFIKPNPDLCQCKLAARAFGIPGGCSGTPPPAACNRPLGLIRALNELSLHSGDPIVGPISFDHVRDTIDSGWPVPVRIVWDDNPGNAHFVVITGYSVATSGAPCVQVDDPFYGRSLVDYDTFVTSYHGSGSWERTYRIA